jgi:hypothetical protein
MKEKLNFGQLGLLGIITRIRFSLSERPGSFFIILLLYLLLAGCANPTPRFVGPTSDPAWSTSEQEIERAERRWKNKQIRSYRIRVRVLGFWNDQSYTVVVQAGKVVDSSTTCEPVDASEPCQVYGFDPKGFTVPGLFAVAREKASLSKMTFDPYYGFPSTISYNHTGIADEEEEWTVLEFQPESP